MSWLGSEEPFEAILGILGLFKMNPMGRDGLVFKLAGVFRMTAMLVIVMGSSMHFIELVQEQVTEIDKSEDFTAFLGNICCYLACAFFVRHRNSWASMVRKMVDFEKYGKPKQIGAIAWRCNVSAKLWFCYTVIGLAVYATVGRRNTGDCLLAKRRRNLNLICDTFIPFHVTFYDIPPKMEPMVFWVQIVFAGVLMVPSGLICFLTYEATQVLSAHMRHLRDLFEELVDEGDARKIGRWVRYHLHILELASNLNDLIKASFNIAPLLSAIVIACCENQLIRSKDVGVGLLLLALLISMMLICYAGQQVASDSLSIADAICDSEWYKTEVKFQKSVVLMLMRAQRPILFHTLPMGTLNYAFFIMVVRASYSYMTLLNQSI